MTSTTAISISVKPSRRLYAQFAPMLPRVAENS
jgi:hypothetical protein